jgi:hypothetical protein
MCEPERGGWGVAGAVKAAAVGAAVCLVPAVLAVAAAVIAHVWLPVALAAAAVAALTAGAVWGLHAHYMVVWCEADPVPARVAEPVPLAVAARTVRALPAAAPAGVRVVVPGVVLGAREEARIRP